MNKMNKCYTSKTTRNKITVLLPVETLKILLRSSERTYWGNEPQSTVRLIESTIAIEVDRGLNGLACCFPGPSGT